MAKAKKAAQKRAARKKATRTPPPHVDVGPLDAALYVTYASEAALGLVEYSHAPSTQVIQEFAVHVQEVPATSSNSGWERDITREIFEANDQREMPFRRVIGRVLDELLNHRRFSTCSGGDIYYVLLEELDLKQANAKRVRLPFRHDGRAQSVPHQRHMGCFFDAGFRNSHLDLGCTSCGKG